MCLTPLVISNPSRRFVRGLSRPRLTVPCGHCKECIQRQQDDWFIRSVFETKRVQSLGGAVWFPTLTFNDEHLHIWHDPKHDYSCPCFDVVDFKRFRDSFRTYLTREGFECSGDRTIRYFYACEYGSKRGRSHIHCLLFVPFHVPSSLMHSVLQKSWKNGFVMWSKRGMIAQTYKASQYCMKYLSKEMSWYKQYGVDKYLQTLHDDIFNASSEDDSVSARELLKRFRRVTPGHKQSLGFGIDGIDYFRNDDGSWNIPALVDGRFDSSKVGVLPTKKGENFMYNMPMYYLRKIFYNTDEWNLYRMNDLGFHVLSLRFQLSLKRASDKYRVYMSQQGLLSQHLSPLCGSVDPVEIYNEIQRLMNYRTSYDLALFNLVYRDIEGTDDNESFIRDFDTRSIRQQLDFLDANALDFLFAQKSIDIEPLPERCRNRAAGHVADVTFNDLPCFSGFSEVLSIIEDLEYKIGSLEQDAYVTQRLQDENLFGVRNGYTSDYLFQNF